MIGGDLMVPMGSMASQVHEVSGNAMYGLIGLWDLCIPVLFNDDNTQRYYV